MDKEMPPFETARENCLASGLTYDTLFVSEKKKEHT